MQNRTQHKDKNTKMVPVIMTNGALARVKISTLPKKDWNVHSGYAKIAGEEVHSLTSQVIKGTKTRIIQADTGTTLSVTNAEAEVFAVDVLTELGYEVIAPNASPVKV